MSQFEKQEEINFEQEVAVRVAKRDNLLAEISLLDEELDELRVTHFNNQVNGAIAGVTADITEILNGAPVSKES